MLFKSNKGDFFSRPYLLFDFTDNFYPLGNERWSITAGVQFGIGRKME